MKNCLPTFRDNAPATSPEFKNQIFVIAQKKAGFRSLIIASLYLRVSASLNHLDWSSKSVKKKNKCIRKIGVDGMCRKGGMMNGWKRGRKLSLCTMELLFVSTFSWRQKIQDGKFTYNVTLGCIRATIAAVEKLSFLHILSGFL